MGPEGRETRARGLAPDERRCDLLAEGRERYTRFLGRKAVATPSKADVRRQRSLAAIGSFTEGAR